MSGASSRNRGARAEVAVVNYLRANGWPDARRYLAGDGRQPGDIDFSPGVCLEVKDRERSSWPSWCAQTVAEAGPNRIPIVVRRTRGVPDVGLWEARMPLNDWAGLAAWPPPHGVVRRVENCYRTEKSWVVATFGAVAGLLRGDPVLPEVQRSVLGKVEWPAVEP